MMDPMNQLPIDAAWVKKVEEMGALAAKELQCMVVTIAIQDGGKLATEVSGVPESGDLHEVAQDVPRLLATLSFVLKMQDATLRGKAQ